MLWKVRALLEDRPGAMAALAASCGDQLVNILDLQIFPTADGRVVDEMVLHAPGGWTGSDVAKLCVLAGVDSPTVTPCSPQALEDRPVRYLRAARVLAEEPERLEEPLLRLVPSTAAQPTVEAGSGSPVVRPGSNADAEAFVAMHGRCSAETVLRRYHSPVARVTPRMARALLEPSGGMSMLMTVGEHVVAAGMFSLDGSSGEPGEVEVEVGLMVEDSWQRRGQGARLLRALAVEAASRGVDTLICMVQPENDAVLRTIRRAGLRARAAYADGLTQYRIPVARLRVAAEAEARRLVQPVSSAGRSSAWRTTSDVTARVRQT